MTGYKVGGGNQIGRTNGAVAKTKVRSRKTTRFFRVVSKIGLTIFIGSFANNLDRVLIGTYCTIRTQTIKLGFVQTFGRNFYFGQ